LLIEDDLELGALLVRGLAEEGFEVTSAATGSEGLQRADAGAPDAMIIDIGLPDADGRDVCQALRARGVQSPVLFLTARDAVTDRLSGFAAGGDDYVVKPFHLAEVAARIRALLKRGGVDHVLEYGRLTLEPTDHELSVGDHRISLTPTEFRLIASLASHPGETLRRRALIRAAWPEGAVVHDNTLDVYIARLRRKLEDLPDAPAISTVHGVGYVLR
jgi:two-component system, OmpR family, response regulator